MRPLEGETFVPLPVFQSTHSLRSATILRIICVIQNRFQSTHSLRSATESREELEPEERVSIHALLAECDTGSQQLNKLKICFNPRTPCGVRLQYTEKVITDYLFQSTHSLRSATGLLYHWRTIKTVSIHALLAECDLRHAVGLWFKAGFNPRTPCGVRQFTPMLNWPCSRFQSTHSLRSATFLSLFCGILQGVSIHALLAECDRLIDFTMVSMCGFNPRTPCGVRPSVPATMKPPSWFQSTHSLRSATISARRN